MLGIHRERFRSQHYMLEDFEGREGGSANGRGQQAAAAARALAGSDHDRVRSTNKF